MKGPKLTKTLFVKSVHNNDNGFLEASSNPSELSEPERIVELGEYRLIRIVKAGNKTTIEK